jgi:hypothetical protein
MQHAKLVENHSVLQVFLGKGETFGKLSRSWDEIWEIRSPVTARHSIWCIHTHAHTRPLSEDQRSNILTSCHVPAARQSDECYLGGAG